MSHIRHIVLPLLIVLLSAASSFATHAARSVTLRMNRTSCAVGDQVYLYIVCEDIGSEPPRLSSVPGFDVKYFVMADIKPTVHDEGNTTVIGTRIKYVATLRAVKEGNFSFGPITVDGVKSNKISYKIGAESQKQSPAAGSAPANGFMPTHAPSLVKTGGNELFLRPEVSNRTPFEQEPVVYSVKLYTSYEGTQILGSPSAPSFQNCVGEESDALDHSLSVETFNGKSYKTGVIQKYILFPSHSGEATITGNVISFSAKQYMEYDDGSAFRTSVYTREQIDARAPEINLNVRPLPPSPDGSHINGVGSFSVKSTFPKQNVSANQILTVKYTVTGSGNLNFVSLPDMTSVLPESLKFVKSDSKVDMKVLSDGVTGTVEFTVSLVPTKEGTVELPPLKFLFFNPTEEKFYTVKADGYTLNVGKSVVTDDDTRQLTFDPELQREGKLNPHPEFVIDSFYYYLVYIIPVLILVLILVIYRRHLRISADVVGLMRKKAGKVARGRLKKSERFMRKGRSQEFYAETLKALWGYMAQKLNIPAADLSRDNVSEKLLGIGASEELVRKVVDVIDNCEMARYASAASVDMKQTYTDASDVINALEKVIPGGRKAQVTSEINNNNSLQS